MYSGVKGRYRLLGLMGGMAEVGVRSFSQEAMRRATPLLQSLEPQSTWQHCWHFIPRNHVSLPLNRVCLVLCSRSCQQFCSRWSWSPGEKLSNPEPVNRRGHSALISATDVIFVLWSCHKVFFAPLPVKVTRWISALEYERAARLSKQQDPTEEKGQLQKYQHCFKRLYTSHSKSLTLCKIKVINVVFLTSLKSFRHHPKDSGF